MLIFEQSEEAPDTGEFEHATDFWSVQRLLDNSDFEKLEAVSKTDYVLTNASGYQMNVKVDYIDRSGKAVELHIQNGGREEVYFDPVEIESPEDFENYWGMMTCYGLAMELDQGMNPGQVFSTQNNAENMKNKVSLFEEEGVISFMERFDGYTFGTDEHIGKRRAHHAAESLANVMNRLEKKGAIDYSVRLKDQNRLAVIEKGGYKFLTVYHPDAPYKTPEEAIDFRY